jgi:pseudouridine kinase
MQFALDDMDVVESITPDHIRTCQDLFKTASLVFLDANLPPPSIKEILKIAKRNKVPVAADPTSTGLAPRLSPHLGDLWLITPNESEAAALCPHPVPHANIQQALAAARHLVSHGVEIAIIAMAEFGVGYATANQSGHVPALRTEIVDPTGAGDAMTAAVLFALLHGIPLDEAVRLGVAAAFHTLRQRGSVAPSLSPEMLYEHL